MNTITVLSLVVSAISGIFLSKQAINYLIYSHKETKGYQITNKKTGRSTTLSVKPTKAEVSRFIDLVEH